MYKCVICSNLIATVKSVHQVRKMNSVIIQRWMSWQCSIARIILIVCMWWSNSKLVVKRNPRGIRYFTCWSEYMKHSEKSLLKKIMRKLQLFAENLNHPQRWESTTIITAPILLTHITKQKLCWDWANNAVSSILLSWFSSAD